MLELADLGKSVVGPSHRRLGRVSQVREDCFRVTTDAGDVWLDIEAVWSVEDRVTLICEPFAVERYLCLNRPSPALPFDALHPAFLPALAGGVTGRQGTSLGSTPSTSTKD